MREPTSCARRATPGQRERARSPIVLTALDAPTSPAAATTLTHLVGDSFAYTDSTELEFGMPPRPFKSFYQASEEAAVSRLYGGIHFRPAIEYGATQGRKVGECVLARIKTRVSQEPVAGK